MKYSNIRSKREPALFPSLRRSCPGSLFPKDGITNFCQSLFIHSVNVLQPHPSPHDGPLGKLGVFKIFINFNVPKFLLQKLMLTSPSFVIFQRDKNLAYFTVFSSKSEASDSSSSFLCSLELKFDHLDHPVAVPQVVSSNCDVSSSGKARQ